MGEAGPMETGEFQSVVLNEIRSMRAEVQETQEAVEETQAAVQKLDKDTAVMKGEIETQLATLKERGEEDRTKRDEQVTKIHERLNGIAAGQSKMAGELEAHVSDANRHAGESPGGGGKVKTAAIGGGAVGGIVLLIEVAKQLMGG